MMKLTRQSQSSQTGKNCPSTSAGMKIVKTVTT